MSYSRSNSSNDGAASPPALTLYTFGCSTEGQLGLAGRDDVQNVVEPTPISPSVFKNKLVTEVACGKQHSLMLLAEGSVYSCGNNESGQLGRSGHSRRPVIVPTLQGLRVIQVACGAAHSVALVDDGHVLTWGSNAFGQLGLGECKSEANEPNEINLSRIIQVACGANHTITLNADGALHAWGDNRFGQIGIGKSTTRYCQPERIQSLNGVPFKSIVAGGGHSFALSVSGAVFAWGRNNCGQLGIGDTEDKCFPVHIKSLRSQNVVRIACGDDFTAALTKDGRLFTFGSGASGQLGHGSSNNETLPKQVFELMGSRVGNMACGRGHTLVVVNGKLYSFGMAGSGQLGLGNDTRQNRLTPMVVGTKFQLKHVYAGGDQSFVLGCSDTRQLAGLPVTVPRIPKHLSAEWIKALIKNPTAFSDDLETIFSSPTCLNCSFLKRNDEHYGTGGKNCGVDMDEAMESFELIASSSSADQITRMIKQAISSHLLPQLVSVPPDIETLRLYVILPWCPVFSKKEYFETVHCAFAQRMSALEKIPWKIIEQWWRSFSTRHLNRVLKIFKPVVCAVLDLPKIDSSSFQQQSPEITRRNEAMKSCLEILSRLNKVNMETRKLPFDTFYVNELETKVDVRAAYWKWVTSKNEHEFSLCNYPFLFNAAVKTMLLQTDAIMQMQMLVNETNRWNFEALFNPFQPMVNPYFELRVSRSNIVEDTISHVLHTATPYELKKPLKVAFQGEEAVDEGGVKKEFFLILFQELLHPKYGMFVEDPESRLLWFANCPFEEPTMFHLVGVLVGLATYNFVLVPLPFPLALYKKLLGHAVTLDDLKELCPTEGRSLEALLDYEDDDFEDVFSLNFTINVSVYGHVTAENLKSGGDQIPVTKENRQEYVDLYVNQKLNKQAKAQLEAFAKGIHFVMPMHIMKFFQPQELLELVGGNEHFDWTEFETNAVYHGEYWRRHPTIQIFWEVFHSLSDEEKKKFLLFLTGSARVPLLGMKELKIQIQPTGGGDKYFPVAHTCYNLLDLPKYTNAEILRKRLLEAIEHNQGFSLV